MSMNAVGRPTAPEIDIETTSFKSLLGGKACCKASR